MITDLDLKQAWAAIDARRLPFIPDLPCTRAHAIDLYDRMHGARDGWVAFMSRVLTFS